MKSFNCSKNILDSLLPIFKELQKTYYAHLSRNKLVKESLFEHSNLVSQYCLKLIESHGIDQILDSLIGQLTEMLPIKNEVIWKNRFKKLFLAAIVYHDLGKINPNFQAIKMENDLFTQNKQLSIQSNHSLLGAYIFSNIFFHNVFENSLLNEDEKFILYFTTLLFAGAIIKHHNPTIDFSLEFDSQQIDDCYSF